MVIRSAFSAAVFSRLIILNGATAPTSNTVNGNCVSGYHASLGYDYFPTKLSVKYADYFNISYHKNYKVITNSYTGDKIVAYQCGTEDPNITDASLTVSVPITASGMTSTTYIPWIEIIGERRSIKAFTSSFSYVTSACLNQMYEQGDTVSVASGWSYNNTRLGNKVDVTFADSWTASAYGAAVLTPEYEGSVLGAAEYIGFVAALFNRESEANEAISNIESRYACTKANVDLLVTSKPRVLWVYYTEDGTGVGGWSVGSCPNYYCEVIEDAGGQMIQYNTTGSVTLWSYYQYLNDTELLSRAHDADALIYQGNFSWAYSIKRDVLNDINAVQASVVFDTYGRGSNDWYESRTAEPDVFLEDMVSAINPDAIPDHTRVWLRAPFDEPVGSASTTCTNVNASLALQADACTNFSSEDSGDDADRDDDGSDDALSTVGIVGIVVVVVVVFGFGATMYWLHTTQSGKVDAQKQEQAGFVEVVLYTTPGESVM